MIAKNAIETVIEEFKYDATISVLDKVIIAKNILDNLIDKIFEYYSHHHFTYLFPQETFQPCLPSNNEADLNVSKRIELNSLVLILKGKHTDLIGTVIDINTDRTECNIQLQLNEKPITILMSKIRLYVEDSCISSSISDHKSNEMEKNLFASNNALPLFLSDFVQMHKIDLIRILNFKNLKTSKEYPLYHIKVHQQFVENLCGYHALFSLREILKLLKSQDIEHPIHLYNPIR